MPVTLADATFRTLSDLVAEAQAAGPTWELAAPSAYLVVFLPAGTDTAPLATDSDSTRLAISPTALPGSTTAVIPLRSGQVFATKGPISLGRSSVCDVVLSLSALSKVHAFFAELTPAVWTIEDLGSKNGTLLNGAPLAPKKPAELPDGAELKLGDVEATFWLRATLSQEIRRQAPLDPREGGP